MATISNTPRPGYVWDSTDNVWYPIGVGAHQHTNAADTPAVIPNAIVDAKGDLLTATADNTPARLAVGANGETLVANSSTSTGLAWAGNYAAGKNKIINGDFGIWQRGTTFNSASTGTYFADRFTCYVAGGTHNITRQTFTPGTAPVAGYEGQYFLRWTAASAGNVALTNKIENVQTFAGQTVKLSFWAKADAAINITTAIYQAFGSGGSSATVNTSGSQAITTSWARYTFTFNIASISGKTIGTGSYLQVDINLPNSTFVFDTWGWQLEAGSIETAFQTATGTIQGELSAAQRYYYRIDNETSNGYPGLSGVASTATLATFQVLPKSTMRIKPTSVDFSSLRTYDLVNAAQTISAITISNGSGNGWSIDVTSSSMSQYRTYVLLANTLPSYLGFSAEL